MSVYLALIIESIHSLHWSSESHSKRYFLSASSRKAGGETYIRFITHSNGNSKIRDLLAGIGMRWLLMSRQLKL